MKGEVRLIQSVQRALDIIGCFNESDTHLTVGEIGRKLSLHINTTRGLVNTLVHNGYLIHNSDDANYSLGYVFIPKAELVNHNSVDRIRNFAKPYLKAIANKYQVSTRLQLVANYNIFTVETVNPENSRYLLLTKLNTPFPLNATSSGKLFLSYQDQEYQENYLDNMKVEKYTSKTIVDRDLLREELLKIKIMGYSVEDEEINVGMSSIAVPVISNSGKMMGSISIVASKIFIDDLNEELLSDMFSAAENLMKDTGIRKD